MRQDWLGSVYNVRKSELSSMLLQGYLPSRLKIVSCPAPSLEEEGSGDTRGFFVTDWNAISSEWAGFLPRNRKNDVVKLP